MSSALQLAIQKAQRIVVFSGAGFSTESGIPDFRSADGLYEKKQYPYACETMLSHSFFRKHPEMFYTFYKQEMIHLDAKPNIAHKALVVLEKQGKLLAIITQNIDGLHQAAGSQNVYELHGSIHRNYCMDCHQFYSLKDLIESEGIPICKHCGGIVKPDVVLYEEGLDNTVVQKTLQAIRQADLLLIAGTSLSVYPAAGFVSYFQGDCLAIINRDETSLDASADIVSHHNICDELAFLIK